MPSRTLKPGFFTNEDLCKLVPLARILFEGLWVLADREGRLEDRPARIKVGVLPYDTCDVDYLLDLLDDAKFIERYTVNQLNYIAICTWKKHQKPHANEPASVIPEPPDSFLQIDEIPMLADMPACQRQVDQREAWFREWWELYWLKKAKLAAHRAFMRHVHSEERYEQVHAATVAQMPEMMSREPSKRPHAATWLNGERWEDELKAPMAKPAGLFSSMFEVGGRP